MPELPSNLVKPPPFDNPLRRTAPSASEAELPARAVAAIDKDEDSQPSSMPATVQSPATPPTAKPTTSSRSAKSARASAPRLVVDKVLGAEPSNVIPIAPEVALDEGAVLPHRITLRIDEVTRLALEAENHKLRMSGKKTNVAEIARSLLAAWATRKA